MSFNLLEALLFFMIVGCGLTILGIIAFLIYRIIARIKLSKSGNGKISMLIVCIVLLMIFICTFVFYCEELLPHLYWPFHSAGYFDDHRGF